MRKADISQGKDEVTKTFHDRASYRGELDIVRGITTSIAPRLLGHDDETMTLRLEHAGKDLSYLVGHEQYRFTVAQIRQVLGGLLQGLSELHAQGYCHYDVTPSKVCIAGDLAKDFHVKLTGCEGSFPLNDIPERYKSERVGTPSCLSPEHLACTPELGEAADVFCAGLTMLQVIQGNLDLFAPSHEGSDPPIRKAHLRVPTQTSWGEPIPGDLNLLLRAMVAVDPTHRRSRLCLDLLGPLD